MFTTAMTRTRTSARRLQRACAWCKQAASPWKRSPPSRPPNPLGQ